METIFEIREETTDARTLSEGDDISGILEVPVLVSPELTRRTDAGFGLVNNEGNSKFLGSTTDLSVEIWSGHLVIEGSDWLDNDSTDMLARVTALLDNVLVGLDASVLLSSVLVLVGGNWELQLRERSSWPVECGQTLKVDSTVTAGESDEGVAVVATLEAKDNE